VSIKNIEPCLPRAGGKMKITIEIEVNSSISKVWNAWVTPYDITYWNFASDDWCCPVAQVDLQVGQKFNYRMEAKDGSMGFDFEGEFTQIELHHLIIYKLADEREVSVEFVQTDDGVKVIESFEAEDENSAELQRQGWFSILTNFKKHVENSTKQRGT
jgi:uncharacterized protein YndB with AHSA1/START domain